MKQGAGIGRRALFRAMAGALLVLPFQGGAPAGAANLPVIAFFRSSPAAPFASLVEAFRKGVAEEGLVEGETVVIEYRWADNKRELLPKIAAELVSAQVSVIVGNSVAVEAARAATSDIPIVFVSADDPVKAGLVDNLARPNANLTGVTFFGGGELAGKRTEILMELAPAAVDVALLIDTKYPGFEANRAKAESAITSIGRRLIVAEVSGVEELEAAFGRMSAAGADAVVIGGSPFLTSQRSTIVKLAAKHKLPTIYDQKDYVIDGGLVSYASSFSEAYRQAGVYAARMVKGAAPSELPVIQPTVFELAVNLSTAKALGIEVPRSILLLADEVIE